MPISNYNHKLLKDYIMDTQQITANSLIKECETWIEAVHLMMGSDTLIKDFQDLKLELIYFDNDKDNDVLNVCQHFLKQCWWVHNTDIYNDYIDTYLEDVKSIQALCEDNDKSEEDGAKLKALIEAVEITLHTTKINMFHDHAPIIDFITKAKTGYNFNIDELESFKKVLYNMRLKFENLNDQFIFRFRDKLESFMNQNDGSHLTNHKDSAMAKVASDMIDVAREAHSQTQTVLCSSDEHIH
jgi:hypothetical protein